MLLVLALFAAVVLGTQTVACIALIFLFREMSAYVHHRALEVAQCYDWVPLSQHKTSKPAPTSARK